jgi:hypothetical protein
MLARYPTAGRASSDMAEASGTTFLDPDDGSLMLDTDGSVRLADGVSDDCCCGCGDDCTCDPDAIPSSLTIDLTNLDLSGCPTSCSPDDSSSVTMPLQINCYYFFQPRQPPAYVLPYHWCWNGKKIDNMAVYWDAGTCRWMGTVAIQEEGADGGQFVGPKCFSKGPYGTYTRINGCSAGSFEVS